MPKKSFENLTIVSVTGSADYIVGSIYAISRSCKELLGAQGLLISPKLPETVVLPDNIRHVEITPFGYMEYNVFMLYQLDCFIHTDYCLVVQNDGWVINGKNWRDEFWDYDYIGAPVPEYHVIDGDKWSGVIGSDEYFKNLDLIKDPKFIELQNGGFSFRSKRLLGAFRRFNRSIDIYPPKWMDDTQPNAHKLDWMYYYHNEDFIISVKSKRYLESEGFKFAPSELASLFSFESTLLAHHRKVPLDNILGAHFCGYLKIVDENVMEFQAKNLFADWADERIVQLAHIRLMLLLGYQLRVRRFL